MQYYNKPKHDYNTVEQYELEDGDGNSPFTIPANTVHGISYKILEGTVGVRIDGNILDYQQGEADSEEADTLISVEYIFEIKDSSGGKIKIKTISV